MKKTLIEATALSSGYGKQPVIQDISFAVHSGERVAIIGPNGCGKTTLLRALAGVLPYSGSLRLTITDAQSPQWGTILERRDLTSRQGARETSLLAQLPSIYFSYTVRETVLTGRYAHQKLALFAGEATADKEAVDRAIAAAGISALADHELDSLSGGQLQRVFLARALAQDSATILLDEPSNHLDLQFQAELIAYLRTWAERENRACVGVFHDLALALEFADTIYLMEAGRIICSLPADAVPASNELNRVYGIDVAARMRSLLGYWSPR